METQDALLLLLLFQSSGNLKTPAHWLTAHTHLA